MESYGVQVLLLRCLGKIRVKIFLMPILACGGGFGRRFVFGEFTERDASAHDGGAVGRIGRTGYLGKAPVTGKLDRQRIEIS